MNLDGHSDGYTSPSGNSNVEEVNVLALVKGEERYVFLYTDQNRAGVLRVLGKFAANPELSFTWYDAAVLSQRIRLDEKTGERSIPGATF